MIKKADIIIIGAGLTGLTLTYLLRNQQLHIVILEARDRVGGRIHTKKSNIHPPIDLGATWIGKQHTAVTSLLKELNIELFEQLLGGYAIYEPISTSLAQVVQLPPNNDPSYRIKGGTDVLIDALQNSLENTELIANEAVKSINKSGDRILINTGTQAYEASKVISTLPPHLLVNNINFNPSLARDVVQLANTTHTWMGESIKVALTYSTPFWKKKGNSGTIFSNVGPILEMYDHSNFEASKFALKGFFNGSYYSISKADRLEMVLTQLEKYYGAQARDYISYEETVWKNEDYTSTEYQTHVLPHQNNRNTVFQQSFWNKSLFLAGTETSSTFGGYMEGAIRSAQYVFEQLRKK